MDGIALMQAVRNPRPPIKVILMSGQFWRGQRTDVPDDIPLFSKPLFKPLASGELTEKLQSLLHSAITRSGWQATATSG